MGIASHICKYWQYIGRLTPSRLTKSHIECVILAVSSAFPVRRSQGQILMVVGLVSMARGVFNDFDRLAPDIPNFAGPQGRFSVSEHALYCKYWKNILEISSLFLRGGGTRAVYAKCHHPYRPRWCARPRYRPVALRRDRWYRPKINYYHLL